MNNEMYVTKRSGEKEIVSFDKVHARLQALSEGLHVNTFQVTQKVLSQIYDGILTSELDDLTSQVSIAQTTIHPDYETLALRIEVSNHQKKTPYTFVEVVEKLVDALDVNGKPSPLLSDEILHVSRSHAKEIEELIDYERDYNLDYFGFKTLERAYLMKLHGTIVERPQHMWMRVSLGIHGDDMDAVRKTYDAMSRLQYTHATPTLFNMGTRHAQGSSCYLVAMENDSIDGIYKTLHDCAMISKWAGGIGVHIHNVRGKGSHIRGTNGTSNGIVPMLRVFNATARYCDQGGGKRKGSFAIYLEPWHSDVEDFLRLKKNHGNEEDRARDLFYALWIPDLFMKRVKEDGNWTLMCPDACPGLADCYGEEFEALYTKYETEGRGSKTMKAQKLWFDILESQIETGTPYMLYKDAANRKSNQQNLGTIKSSNLCSEIIEYSDKDETAVCNLASIALSKCVDLSTDGTPATFNYERLLSHTKQLVRNLNRIIDINFYPTEKTYTSNVKHRPIGIGVQGLADVFAMMGLPFTSPDAKQLNFDIFETIYYGACLSSCEIAQEHALHVSQLESEMQASGITSDADIASALRIWNKTNTRDVIIREELFRASKQGSYSTFEGSPMSQGKFQFDLWNAGHRCVGSKWAWDVLAKQIKEFGVRNSLLLAPMPTASTSQILGNNECFEPFTSNIYTRRTLAGEFIVVNKHLVRDLLKLGVWNEDRKQSLIQYNGSIQHMDDVPVEVRQRYKTVWELKMKDIIDMSADRGCFVCQSQSLNLFMAEPDYSRLSSMHFYAWSKGLKTGMYYLRTNPKVRAQQFTVDPSTSKNGNSQTISQANGPEECLMCSA